MDRAAAAFGPARAWIGASVGGGAIVQAASGANTRWSGVLQAGPSVGVAALSFFDLLRIDLARGLKNGRWMFNIDVNRDFWTIM